MALKPINKATRLQMLEKLTEIRKAKQSKLEIGEEVTEKENHFDDEFEDNEKLCNELSGIEKQVLGSQTVETCPDSQDQGECH